jgi:hypothetical protein
LESSLIKRVLLILDGLLLPVLILVGVLAAVYVVILELK